MHALSASITSALALKPSTVYILRVVDAKTNQSWHLRRCFSEFCELREKLLALIDEQMAAYLTSPEIDGTEISFSTSSSTVSSSTSSSSTCTGISRHLHTSKVTPGRFAYLFKQFPPRKLFGSRSKRVIEARSQALNQFLRQALEVVEVVRQRQLIAICFSMMTHLETFLECGSHRKAAPSVVPSSTVSSGNRNPTRRGTVSPSATRRASAAVALTPGFHHYPLVPTPSFTMTLSDQRYQNRSKSNAHNFDDSNDNQVFNNFDFTRRFYREFGRQEERGDVYSDDSDDEEMHLLKKTWSAMTESEMRERALYHSGSHFSMLETSHSPSETWAKRVEIAGIYGAAHTCSSRMFNATLPVQPRKTTQTTEPLQRHRSTYRIHARHNPACV